MAQVDFYILANNRPDGRALLTCRLVHKAYHQKHRIYIHVDTQAQAQYIDDLLWTYQVNSFLPHERIDQTPHPFTPILIGFGQDAAPKEIDVLINLSQQIPSFYHQFERILELVDQDPNLLQTMRQHYRFYRDQNLIINNHKI